MYPQHVQNIIKSESEFKITCTRGSRPALLSFEQKCGRATVVECNRYHIYYQFIILPKHACLTENTRLKWYAVLLLFDFFYFSEDFRLIKSVNLSLSEAMIEWRDNWVTLIENMLQLVILNQNYDGVLQPTQINRIVIDTIESSNQTFTKHGKCMLKVNFSNICGLIQ